MDGAEQAVLDARTRTSDQRVARLAWSLAALVAALAGLLGLLYVHVRRWQNQEDRLLVAEQRFHLMAQNVAEYAIVMLDGEGHVQTWNVGAERIKGYAAGQIVGRHFSRFYPPEDAHAGKPAQALHEAATAGRYVGEGWRVRKDGSRFWASVVITALREADGSLTGFLEIMRDLTDRRRAEEALRAEIAETHRVERQLQEVNQSLEAAVAQRTAALTVANAELAEASARLHDLSVHLIDSQENERRRISLELHDETGQALTGIKLRLSAGLRNGSLGSDGIEQCIDLVDDTIGQIRRLVLDLRPLVLDDLGLADAVEATLQRTAESAGWTISLNVDGLPPKLPPALETACFRIVQETLTNAARHAGADTVKVHLAHRDRELVVTIRDDGQGFDPVSMRTPEMRRAHFGLVSMTERATLAGGRLDIDSSPGRGTTVRVVFPMPQGEDNRAAQGARAIAGG
jgi:PAS domain S-box-containing protein